MSHIQELRIYGAMFTAAGMVSLDWPMVGFAAAIFCHTAAIFLESKTRP